MKKLFTTLRRTRPKQILKRVLFRLNGRVVNLKPHGAPRGNVLLSYITTPFTLLAEDQFNGHTNYWETRDMARAFLERGYAVDVIDKTNAAFVPRRKYAYFIDIESNLARIAPLLNPDCIKIFHATGAHWQFQNAAEAARITDLEARRGITLLPRRMTQPYDVTPADLISSLCGPFPESTYAFLKKPIYHIPLSTTHTYPKPEKDYDSARKQFIWFGGAGAVHKGLDLVLEAFAAMPEYTLLVCGKFGEQDFNDAYHKELFETPNIRAIGYLDPGSDQFKKITHESLGIVFPSCSEGCASSVVVTMHAGLIPIVSRESGIETEDFGIILSENTIEAIRAAVRALASEPSERLSNRSIATWSYARANHTRERFAEAYRSFVSMLEEKHI